MTQAKRPLEILLVEDDAADAHLTLEALRRSTVLNHAQHVWDGEMATQHLLDAVPDLVILDLNLPKKGGREVLREIKSDPRLRSVPVVIFTTSTTEWEVREAYEEFANCYVCKPVELDRYLERVENMAQFWSEDCTLPAWSGG
ncbi:MAG: response regulator [Terriglobales bacterium]